MESFDPFENQNQSKRIRRLIYLNKKIIKSVKKNFKYWINYEEIKKAQFDAFNSNLDSVRRLSIMFLCLLIKFTDLHTLDSETLSSLGISGDLKLNSSFFYLNKHYLIQENKRYEVENLLASSSDKAVVMYKRFKDDISEIKKLNLKMIYLALKKKYFDIFPDSFKHYYWISNSNDTLSRVKKTILIGKGLREDSEEEKAARMMKGMGIVDLNESQGEEEDSLIGGDKGTLYGDAEDSEGFTPLQVTLRKRKKIKPRKGGQDKPKKALKFLDLDANQASANDLNLSDINSSQQISEQEMKRLRALREIRAGNRKRMVSFDLHNQRRKDYRSKTVMRVRVKKRKDFEIKAVTPQQPHHRKVLWMDNSSIGGNGAGNHRVDNSMIFSRIGAGNNRSLLERQKVASANVSSRDSPSSELGLDNVVSGKGENRKNLFEQKKKKNFDNLEPSYFSGFSSTKKVIRDSGIPSPSPGVEDGFLIKTKKMPRFQLDQNAEEDEENSSEMKSTSEGSTWRQNEPEKTSIIKPKKQSEKVYLVAKKIEHKPNPKKPTPSKFRIESEKNINNKISRKTRFGSSGRKRREVRMKSTMHSFTAMSELNSRGAGLDDSQRAGNRKSAFANKGANLGNRGLPGGFEKQLRFEDSPLSSLSSGNYPVVAQNKQKIESGFSQYSRARMTKPTSTKPIDRQETAEDHIKTSENPQKSPSATRKRRMKFKGGTSRRKAFKHPMSSEEIQRGDWKNASLRLPKPGNITTQNLDTNTGGGSNHSKKNQRGSTLLMSQNHAERGLDQLSIDEKGEMELFFKKKSRNRKNKTFNQDFLLPSSEMDSFHANNSVNNKNIPQQVIPPIADIMTPLQRKREMFRQKRTESFNLSKNPEARLKETQLAYRRQQYMKSFQVYKSQKAPRSKQPGRNLIDLSSGGLYNGDHSPSMASRGGYGAPEAEDDDDIDGDSCYLLKPEEAEEERRRRKAEERKARQRSRSRRSKPATKEEMRRRYMKKMRAEQRKLFNLKKTNNSEIGRRLSSDNPLIA